MLLQAAPSKFLSSSPQNILLIVLPIFLLFFIVRETSRWPGLSGSSAIPVSSHHEPKRPTATGSSTAEIFDNAAEGSSRLSQVTMHFGENRDHTIERSLKLHIEHGEKWGYPIHILRQPLVGTNDGGNKVYSKLWWLSTIMVNEMSKPFGKGADWLVWYDSDTVVTNSNVPWTIFLPPSEFHFAGINLLVTTDWFGFNAGVFLIRVCDWSLNLLADAMALPRLQPKVELGFHEQTAMQKMFDTDARIDHRLYVPRHWFNVYDDVYAPQGEITYNGSMLIHFPALNHLRLKAMGKFLDKLERDPLRAQIPLDHTTYPNETTGYWTRLDGAFGAMQKAREFEERAKSGNDKAFYEQQGKDVFKVVQEKVKNLKKAVQTEAFSKQIIIDRTKEVKEAYDKAVAEWHKKKAAAEGKEWDGKLEEPAQGKIPPAPKYDKEGERLPQSPGG